MSSELNANKKDIIENLRLHNKDCGSSIIQISSLSFDIDVLTTHLKKFKKDNHSKIGLIKKVNLRKSLLKYLRSKDKDKYEYITKYLNIRK